MNRKIEFLSFAVCVDSLIVLITGCNECYNYNCFGQFGY